MAKTESAKDSTREAAKDASKAVRDAQDGADSVLADIQSALDALTQRVHKLSDHGKAMAADAGRQTRNSMHEACEQVSAHVAEKPFQSVAMATAAGVVFGWLLSRH